MTFTAVVHLYGFFSLLNCLFLFPVIYLQLFLGFISGFAAFKFNLTGEFVFSYFEYFVLMCAFIYAFPKQLSIEEINTLFTGRALRFVVHVLNFVFNLAYFVFCAVPLWLAGFLYNASNKKSSGEVKAAALAKACLLSGTEFPTTPTNAELLDILRALVFATPTFCFVTYLEFTFRLHHVQLGLAVWSLLSSAKLVQGDSPTRSILFGAPAIVFTSIEGGLFKSLCDFGVAVAVGAVPVGFAAMVTPLFLGTLYSIRGIMDGGRLYLYVNGVDSSTVSALLAALQRNFGLVGTVGTNGYGRHIRFNTKQSKAFLYLIHKHVHPSIASISTKLSYLTNKK
jgi:hypothetical protein